MIQTSPPSLRSPYVRPPARHHRWRAFVLPSSGPLRPCTVAATRVPPGRAAARLHPSLRASAFRSSGRSRYRPRRSSLSGTIYHRFRGTTPLPPTGIQPLLAFVALSLSAWVLPRRLRRERSQANTPAISGGVNRTGCADPDHAYLDPSKGHCPKSSHRTRCAGHGRCRGTGGRVPSFSQIRWLIR